MWIDNQPLLAGLQPVKTPYLPAYWSEPNWECTESAQWHTATVGMPFLITNNAIKGLFEYRIRIHNESGPKVNPTYTRHASVIRFAKWIWTEIQLELELDASVNPSHRTDDIGEES